MTRFAARMLVLFFMALVAACSNQPATGPQAPRSQTAAASPETQHNPGPANGGNVFNQVLQCYARITETLASVRDEQSARAAAPQLTQLTDQLKPILDQLVREAVIAAASGVRTGSDADTHAGIAAFQRLQSEIERVYPTPAGQVIHAELRRLLDTLVGCAVAGERNQLQRWISTRQLDR
jgi:hypothetical protein